MADKENLGKTLERIIEELRELEKKEEIKKSLLEEKIMPFSDLIGILYSNLGESFTAYVLSLKNASKHQEKVSTKKDIFEGNIDIALDRWKRLVGDNKETNEVLHELLLYFANDYQVNINSKFGGYLNETVNNLGVVYDELKDYYDANDSERFNHSNFIKLHSFIGLFSFNLEFLHPSSDLSRLRGFYSKKDEIEESLKNKTFTKEYGFLLSLFDFINSLLITSAYMDSRIMGVLNKEGSIILDYKKAIEKTIKLKNNKGEIEEKEEKKVVDDYYNKFNISKSNDEQVNQTNYEKYVDLKKYEHDIDMISLNIDALRFKNNRSYLIYDNKLLCNKDGSPQYVSLYDSKELYKKYYGGITRDFLMINGKDYKDTIINFLKKYENYSFLHDVTRYVYFATYFNTNIANKNIGKDKAVESLRKIIQFKIGLYDMICEILDYYSDETIFKLNFIEKDDDVEYDAAPDLPCYKL